MKNIETLWFYLEPYTFISEDAKHFFFYNAKTSKGISFRKNRSFNLIVRELQNIENLYSVWIDVKDLENEHLYNFIETIQASAMGDIIEGELPKPLLMPPMLNLQYSVERLKKHEVSINEDILSHLQEVAIYINGECGLSCKGCKRQFKQHLCCTKSENTLDFRLLEDFLFSISYIQSPITIVGGNIFLYAPFQELLDMLAERNVTHTFVTNWQNIPDDQALLNRLAHDFFRLKITVSDSYPIDSVMALAKKLRQANLTQLWEISITSISEYEIAEMLSEQLVGMDIQTSIKPFYNGENLSFFEENIFIDEEHLSEISLDKQSIFALQALSTHDFGKITILPNGKVYANVNREPIGDMMEPIGDIICKELESGKSWRHTRYNMEPCSLCRFRLICPSPSNYELAIGKPDLCHIK